MTHTDSDYPHKEKAEKWGMLSDPTTKNIAFQLASWKEKAILNESKAKDFDELWRENKKLRAGIEEIKKYKTAINEAKNKSQSPLEHHALQSAESTIKAILKSMGMK